MRPTAIFETAGLDPRWAGRTHLLLLGTAAVVFACVVLAGCASFGAGRAQPSSFVTIQATVDAYDPDGTLFDLVSNTREFDPGTISRCPLSRVVVTAPGSLAGRKFLIALPEETAADGNRAGDGLRKRGAAVAFALPRALVSRGQREIIEWTELKWPAPEAESASGLTGRAGRS